MLIIVFNFIFCGFIIVQVSTSRLSTTQNCNMMYSGISLDHRCLIATPLPHVISFSICAQKCCKNQSCDLIRFRRKKCYLMNFADLDQCEIYKSEVVKKDLIYIKAAKTLPKRWSNFLSSESTDCVDDIEIGCKSQEDNRCQDRSGHYVKIGELYSPNYNCMFCVCANKSSAHICLAPLCGLVSAAECERNPNKLCCKCQSSIKERRFSISHVVLTFGAFVTAILVLLSYRRISSYDISRRVIFGNNRQNRIRRQSSGLEIVDHNSSASDERSERLIENIQVVQSDLSNTQDLPPSYQDLYECNCNEHCTCSKVCLTEVPSYSEISL